MTNDDEHGARSGVPGASAGLRVRLHSN